MAHISKYFRMFWICLVALSLVSLAGCVVDRNHGHDHDFHDHDFHDHDDHYDHDHHGTAQPAPDLLAAIQP